MGRVTDKVLEVDEERAEESAEPSAEEPMDLASQSEGAPEEERAAELEKLVKGKDAGGAGRSVAKKAEAPRRERPEQTAAERTRAGAVKLRKLKARIVRKKDGKLAVQFVTDDAGLDWKPKHVMLRLKDGSMIPVTIDTALTTREAMLPPELGVTLALDLPALASEPEAIQVVTDTEVLYLELDA